MLLNVGRRESVQVDHRVYKTEDSDFWINTDKIISMSQAKDGTAHIYYETGNLPLHFTSVMPLNEIVSAVNNWPLR